MTSTKTQADYPANVAIIMDGNGRWAQKRGRDRTFGHIRGSRVAKEIVTECGKIGVKQLTLYAFSSENWLRPQTEVTFLMRLLNRYVVRELKNLLKNEVRVTVIGDLSRVPRSTVEAVEKSMTATAHCKGLQLTFAFSYGSRQEITQAVQDIAKKAAAGELSPDAIDQGMVASHLQSAFIGDPDLIIRTSGEFRISNFLLWQAAYSEFYITPVLWPDFTRETLALAFSEYAKRQRRFGKTQGQISDEGSDESL